MIILLRIIGYFLMGALFVSIFIHRMDRKSALINLFIWPISLLLLILISFNNH